MSLIDLKRSTRPVNRWCVPVALVTLSLAVNSASAQENLEKFDSTRSALEQWVETERLISKEQQELELSREVMAERIGLVKREIESFDQRIKEAEASISEADKKRDELVQQNEALKEASASLKGILESLEKRTLELVAQIPHPIQERVKPLTQRIPAPGTETKLSTSERFQNVVGVLNEINKFNRDITVVSEVRQLEDGTSAEVTALYLGIGHSFYSGANGTIAGVGTATEKGWEWKAANESAAEIAKAIAILQNEQIASFVLIPVEVE